MRKGLTVYFAVLFIVSACRDIDEKSVFEYPVSVIDMPKVEAVLSPELVSGLDYPTSSFHMLGDSVMLAYNKTGGANDYFFSLIGIDNADTLAVICRKGRGSEEMLLPSVYFDVVDGTAFIIDKMTSRLFGVNLEKSLHERTTVVDYKTQLDITYAAGASISQNRWIYPDKFVCFNSRVSSEDYNLTGTPYFSVYNQEDGSHLKDIHCFGEIPCQQTPSMKATVQRTLAMHSTSNPKTGQMCFMNVSVPQINFLDSNSGDVYGIRLGHKMSLSLKKPYSCFSAVCSDEERIYGLFSGVKAEEFGHVDSKLLIMDWQGNIQGFYQLDGPYFTFDLADGTLYLAKADMEQKLYKLRVADLSDWN